jgi:hypothetical protein
MRTNCSQIRADTGPGFPRADWFSVHHDDRHDFSGRAGKEHLLGCRYRSAFGNLLFGSLNPHRTRRLQKLVARDAGQNAQCSWAACAIARA